jgi:hypothetical protein
LADAIAAAQDGDSIYALGDAGASITVNVNGNVIKYYAADADALHAGCLAMGMVALVDDVYYQTIAAAIEAANGGSIELVVSTTLEDAIAAADAAAKTAGMKFRMGNDKIVTYYKTYADAAAVVKASAGTYTIYVIADYEGAVTQIKLNAANWHVSIVGVGETAPKLTFTTNTTLFLTDGNNANNVSITLENVEITVAGILFQSDGNKATNSNFTLKKGTTIKTATSLGVTRLFRLYDPCNVTIDNGAKIVVGGQIRLKDGVKVIVNE